MSITAQQIESVVRAEDDFGFELRVGAALSNVKFPQIINENTIVFRPVHGGTYRDPVSGKPREFDYRCRVNRAETKNILLAIECKNVNADTPVVVCGRPRNGDEAYHEFFDISPTTRSTYGRRVEGISSIYPLNEFVGKRIIRIVEKGGKLCASKEGESEIYDRWAQALASTHDLVSGSINGGADEILPERSRVFIMPTVVLPDGALWRTGYDDSGILTEKPTPIDHCEYYVDYKLGFPAVCLTHIHFATLNGLLQMLQGFVTARGRIWDSIFSRDAMPTN